MTTPVTAATQAISEFGNQVGAFWQKAANVARVQLDQADSQLIKGYDEVVAQQLRTADAFKAAAEVLIAGSEQASALVAGFARASLTQAVDASKALLAVKSPAALLDLQQAQVKASLGALRVQAEQLSSLSVKVANDAVAPISARVLESVEIAKQRFAA